MSECPECDKLHSVSKESQIIGEFLEWLGSADRTVCKFDEERFGGTYWPDNTSIERLLAEYYDIDLDKVEKERRQILETLQEVNQSMDLLEVLS